MLRSLVVEYVAKVEYDAMFVSDVFLLMVMATIQKEIATWSVGFKKQNSCEQQDRASSTHTKTTT